jgi:hypothetical protein
MKLLAPLLAALIGFSSFAARAADDADLDKDDGGDTEISNILSSVGYPELQVVPRASERLRLEARAERGNWFVQHWPVELSGLATMFVGLSSRHNRRDDITTKEKSDADSISAITTAVGAGWLLGGLILGIEKPYANGYRGIAKRKDKDERDALLKERLAEEALERPAKVMRALQYVSLATNFTMSALNIPYSNDKGKVTAGVGAVLAFLPLLFTDHTIEVYDKHIEYKKKIYAPLKTGALQYDPVSHTFTPMTKLVWMF